MCVGPSVSDTKAETAGTHLSGRRQRRRRSRCSGEGERLLPPALNGRVMAGESAPWPPSAKTSLPATGVAARGTLPGVAVGVAAVFTPLGVATAGTVLGVTAALGGEG